MKWWPSPCKPGDMLRVRAGAVYHYGIFVTEEEVIQFGPPPVASAMASSGDFKVMATDMDGFCCGAIVEVAIPETREERRRFSPKKTVELARASLGQGGYDLLHNNCEHFAYECVYGVKKSTQAEEVRRRWLSRPVLNVYVLPLEEGLPMEAVYPPQRQQEIAQAQGELRQRKQAAWMALEQGLRHAFGADIHKLTFQKTPAGKWTCKEYGISLTHTEGAVAVAVSNDPVGVDMENAQAFAPKFAAQPRDSFCRRALTAREQAKYPDPDLAAFLALWTRKESIFKRQGGSRFVPNEIETEGSQVRTQAFSVQGQPMVLSVCSPKVGSLSCYLLSQGKAYRMETKNL